MIEGRFDFSFERRLDRELDCGRRRPAFGFNGRLSRELHGAFDFASDRAFGRGFDRSYDFGLDRAFGRFPLAIDRQPNDHRKAA
ncbi:MAG TPA: hypothetical protein VGE81_02545, partial [Candidatus Limnocylindrales bacterium]